MLEVLRSGQLSLGPRLPEFERDFAARLGARARERGLQRHRRASPRAARGRRVTTATRSSPARSRSWPRPTRSLYERARPVFADIDPVTLNLDPAAAAAAITERTRALLPVHIFGYPADLPAFERLAERHGLAIVEDACEALGRRHGDGPAGRRPRPPGRLRLLRQQAADDRRGRDGHARRRGHEGAHRLRAQPGPRARHGLARPRPPGLQLPALRAVVRDRDRAARASAADARRAGRRPPSATARRSPGSRTSSCRARTPAATAAAGSCSSSSCPGIVTATRSSGRWRRADPEQALPARDPPDELLPRALRPSRGRVPGLRGRGRALARAAVLPADDRGAGRARVASAEGDPRRGAAVSRHTLRACRASPSPRTRTSEAERLDRLRPPALAARRRAVARPREDARGAGDHRRGGPRAAAGRARRGRGRAERGRLPVPGRRRGHPHGGRAAADRDHRSRRRQAPHRPLSQRPGRDRPGAVHARASGRRGRAPRLADDTLLERAEEHVDWPMPGYTHLQRAQPVYLAHHLLAYFWMFDRDRERFAFAEHQCRAAAARRGRARGRELRHRPPPGGRRARLRGRGRNSLDAVSGPRLRAGLPRCGGDLRDPPLASGRGARAVVQQRVRLRRAVGLVELELLDHAAEEEPRCRRAVAGQGPAGWSPTSPRCTASSTRCR